jgi:DNA-binding transcriptional MerR regulator
MWISYDKKALAVEKKEGFMKSENLTEKYMIREAAKQVGVETHVLRYWEKELSLEVPKNDMGHRFYSLQEITLLRQVKYLKDQGFHLKAIRFLKKNINEVTQLDTAKLHSLRDRLNGQLMAESAEEQQEKAEAETKNKKEEEVIAVHTGTPTGKKIKIVEENVREKPSLLELELAQPEENVRTFDVLQGGRTEKGYAPVLEEEETQEKEKLMVKRNEEGQAVREQDGRMEQFRAIMGDIIGEALRENNEKLARNVGGCVSERVIEEMDYIMHSQQQKEEERYRKLDEAIRSYQKSRHEAAASQERVKKRKHGLFSIKRQDGSPCS